MNRILFVLLPCLVVMSSMAQTPGDGNADESRERRSRQPAPMISPEIHDDGRVSFRLRAPEFTRVALQGQWPEGRLNMTKDYDGLWSVTAGPIEPGVWEYSFEADGFAMIDPGNPAIKPMRSPRTSILHLPGDPPLIHDFQDVPHGTVRAHTYHSKSLDTLRDLVVYTPPDYDALICRFEFGLDLDFDTDPCFDGRRTHQD